MHTPPPEAVLEPMKMYRYEGDRIYDRDKVVRAVTELYELLTKLPYVQPSEVTHPPEGGWPEITQQSLASLGKNDDVVDLLKHLPYVDIQSDSGLSVPVEPWTYLLDYRSPRFLAVIALGEERARDACPSFFIHVEDFTLPKWVVPITQGGNWGRWLLLDTSDGTITRFSVQSCIFDPSYSPDDPRAWRDECDGPTKPAEDYLDDIKRSLEQFECIACFFQGQHDTMNPIEDMDAAEKVKALYRQYGWPDDFRRDDCRSALIKWDADGRKL